MTFLQPWALLLLGLIPPLVLLYFLKLKRPSQRVPSTLLWRKVLQDMRVNSPFQRLKRSLLLLLQILALVAVAVALARPMLQTPDRAGQSLVVLLDHSASMQAREPDGRTRLDHAKAAIQAVIAGLARDDELMLIAFHSRARAVCGFTSDKNALREALAAVAPADCPTRLDPALLLARPVALSRTRPRLLLFSDGAFESREAPDLPVPLEFQRVGSPRPNLAVTGLDVRRASDRRDRLEMFVSVENFSDQTMSGAMVVKLDGVVLDSKFFSVTARETLSQIFEADLPGGGNLEVAFEADDALACDNRAWKVIRPPRARRVWLVGERNHFVERALRAAPQVELRVSTPAAFDPAQAGEDWLVIWNAVPAPGLAPGANLYLGCVPSGLEGLAAGPSLEGQAVLDWDQAHPVNRFLDFDNLAVGKSFTLELPPQARVLVRGSRSPLAAVLDAGGRPILVTAFDPLQSNWPLLLSFPLFLNNALAFAHERMAERQPDQAAAGAALTLASPGGAPSVTLPSGRRVTLNRGVGDGYGLSELEACGLYAVELPGQDGFTLAVNLFDPRESNLDTPEVPMVGGKPLAAGEQVKRLNTEYWTWAVVALFALLLLEWWVYHRRILT
jgi:hypothetical protein